MTMKVDTVTMNLATFWERAVISGDQNLERLFNQEWRLHREELGRSRGRMKAQLNAMFDNWILSL